MNEFTADNKNDALRLPQSTIQSLSRISPNKAMTAVCFDWLVIATAIAACLYANNVAAYVAAIIVIGGRQHSLAIIGHDAVHRRFLNNRVQNDWIGSAFVLWPIFLTLGGFRKYHLKHHLHLNEEDDGNRTIWGTHTQNGELTSEWTYPKTARQLCWKLFRRASFITGVFWIVRGTVSSFMVRVSWALLAGRLMFIAALAFLLTTFSIWGHFLMLWVVPYCSWHILIQYMRVVAEHSVVHCDHSKIAGTRTTIPGPLEAFLILPRNVGYHIEHHLYPGIPFYNLPLLHEELMRIPQFEKSAVVSRSIFSSLHDVCQPRQQPARANA